MKTLGHSPPGVVLIIHPIGAHLPTVLNITLPAMNTSNMIREQFSTFVPPLTMEYPDLMDINLIFYSNCDIIGFVGAMSVTPSTEDSTQIFQLGPILETIQSKRVTVRLPMDRSCQVINGWVEFCISPYPPGCHSANEAVMISQIVNLLRHEGFRGSHPATAVQTLCKQFPLYESIMREFYSSNFNNFILHHTPNVFHKFMYSEQELQENKLYHIHPKETRVILTEDKLFCVEADRKKEENRTRDEEEVFQHTLSILKDGPIDAKLLMSVLCEECPAFQNILYPSLNVLLRILSQHPQLFVLRNDPIHGTLVDIIRESIKNVLNQVSEAAMNGDTES